MCQGGGHDVEVSKCRRGRGMGRLQQELKREMPVNGTVNSG